MLKVVTMVMSASVFHEFQSTTCYRVSHPYAAYLFIGIVSLLTRICFPAEFTGLSMLVKVLKLHSMFFSNAIKQSGKHTQIKIQILLTPMI